MLHLRHGSCWTEPALVWPKAVLWLYVEDGFSRGILSVTTSVANGDVVRN